MIREKSRPRFTRRILSIFAVVLGASLLVLWIRPLFAQPLELSRYTAADAGAYRALPFSGPNFTANSRIGYGAGRYYLKGNAVACIVAAYAELARTNPHYQYIYGEMGWKGGGLFRPHRTHQQGMSADFMTPVRTTDAKGESFPSVLPCNAANLWGYAIRLDDAGGFENFQLDTKAMIAHLAALQKAAPHYGLRIRRVIFDPPLLKRLRADPDFSRLRGMRFMENKAWFPHDGHYHVDFAERQKTR